MQRLSINNIRIKTAALIISTFAVALSSAALPAGALDMGGPSDCNSNAVIRCGAHSTIELKRAYQNDPYVQDVYNDFGISNQDVHNIGRTSVSGKVTNRGNVYVDDKSKPVATNAMTAGRTNMSGSDKSNSGSSTYYKRPTSVSMQRPSLPAYVVMDSNGQFKYAVIASCGNPVTATPVTPAPAPTAPQQPSPPQPTAPAPAQNQQQQQEQQQQVIINNTTVNQSPATPSPAADTSVPAPEETTPTPSVSTAQSQEQNQAQQQGQQQQQEQQQAQTTPVATTTETTPVTTTTTQPQSVTTTALPNTGAAGVIVLFVLSTAAGFYWYRKYITHIMTQ
jgi:hypothetical protein